MTLNEKYFKEIIKEQPLSDEEERTLAAKIKIGDAKALEKLTKSNLKFVISLAHQYISSLKQRKVKLNRYALELYLLINQSP